MVAIPINMATAIHRNSLPDVNSQIVPLKLFSFGNTGCEPVSCYLALKLITTLPMDSTA